MKNLLNKFRYYGTSLGHPRWLNRNIIVANSISLATVALVLILLLVHVISHPEESINVASIVTSAVILSVLFINRAGYHRVGRTVLTVGLVFGALAITIARKTTMDPVPMNTFFQSRAALTVFCVIPFAIIHFRERRLLILNLLICLTSLVLYDPIHNALGIGFYQLGFSDPDYYYGTVIYVIIFLILTAAAGFFKYEIDVYERENEELINTLHTRNVTIEDQKEELTSQGEILKELLKERDKDLSQVTQELINFNHELLQYSYTVSHNLRGPVARILGLLDLYFNYSDEKEKRNIAGLILESTRELDKITLDLNKIVEGRNDSFNVREKVNFADELKQIRKLLESPIKNHGIKLIEQFNVPEIFSARQRINHLLYILITNAIQYRRPGQTPQIKISTYKKDKWVVLEIQDNGRGIDLDLYRGDLFKPFKYFHPEASGKGINLYLAKLQAERLHGHIDVRSIPGEGTVFSVYLKDWQEMRG
ncbi:MAG TPA: HAMP domain-containing sensor histidine kinase [Chryseolinea sp.]|nr:HAMP domain-containing sensor histidine kinase [Chryseolinea sp.]